MIKKFRCVLFVPFLLVGACSSEDKQETSAPGNNNPVFQDQMRALEKAKGVEKIIQDEANQTQQAIEDQSK
jgi:hypothetical protein